MLQTDRPTYSLLFLVTVFKSGHVSAMQLVPRLPAGMLRFPQFPNFQLGGLGFVHVLCCPFITDTQKQWEWGHRSGELNNGLWKLEIQLKWEAISSAPLVNIIKWRSYNLWISVEREAVECSRLSGKGIVFENEDLMQDEEQKVQAFYILARAQQLLLTNRVPGGMKFHRGERGPTCSRPRQTEMKKKMQSRVNTIYSKIWTTKRVIVWSYGTFKELTFCDFLHPSTITSVLLTCSPAKWACNPVNEATVQHSLQKEGEFHLGWRTHTHTKN